MGVGEGGGDGGRRLYWWEVGVGGGGWGWEEGGGGGRWGWEKEGINLHNLKATPTYLRILAVASSRTRILYFLRGALARHTSCL